MGKVIEIRLSDAQHAALTEAHNASGGTFFEFCRAKLMDGLTTPLQRSPKLERARIDHAERLVQGQPRVIAEDDRISRIEDALTRLTDYVLQGQAPDEAQHQQAAAPVDIDSLVNAQFAEAEAAGLTQHVPDEADVQMAQSGVRPLSRRPVPFSASGGPRHLRELG